VHVCMYVCLFVCVCVCVYALVESSVFLPGRNGRELEGLASIDPGGI
jgi:hypothetical protein